MTIYSLPIIHPPKNLDEVMQIVVLHRHIRPHAVGTYAFTEKMAQNVAARYCNQKPHIEGHCDQHEHYPN